MDYRKTNAPTTTVTRDMMELCEDTGNVYESVAIIGKRANQISVEIKNDLSKKLAEFASYNDNLEEVFENREQIEISRYYEKLPKPTLIATQEYVEGKIYYRNPAKEKKITVMIQRIQSVYLLLVTILLVVAICMPVGQFIGADGVTAHVFKPLGVALADGGFQSTWGLFGILLLSALVAFCTIFLFRNRMLQIRMTIFSSILLIGYYIAFCVFMFILKGDLDAMTFQLGWALCLPVVAIILNYLAFRAIYKDEVMVKAADRLRR